MLLTCEKLVPSPFSRLLQWAPICQAAAAACDMGETHTQWKLETSLKCQILQLELKWKWFSLQNKKPDMLRIAVVK